MEYLPFSEATRLRIIDYYDGFAVDACATRDEYVDAVWSVDPLTGQPIATVERAAQIADEFAKQYAPHLVGTRPVVHASATARCLRELAKDYDTQGGGW